MLISLIPYAMVAVGAWLIWWGLRRRRARVPLPQGWRTVEGEVIDVGDRKTVPPRIEYRANGRRLRVPGPTSVRFEIGQRVAVLLDPADPTRARLELTEREAQLVVTMLLVTGTVLLAIGLVTAAVLM